MYAFIHMDKTGGTTVKWMLRSSFGVRHCDVESWRSQDIPFLASDLRCLRRLYPGLKSIAGHHVVPYVDLAQACPEIQFFTLLRDPLKRCASFFQYIVQTADKDCVFEDWIQTAVVRDAQTQKIAGTVDVDAAIQMIQEKGIFVGLTESFDESMLLLKTLFINSLNIFYIPMNVARNSALANSLLTSEGTSRMLRDANRADLELYEYVKREIYPSYRRAYGNRLSQDVLSYRQNQIGLDARNVMLNRLYRNLIYKPALKLHRGWLNLACVISRP
jgi:hypothetical protein